MKLAPNAWATRSYAWDNWPSPGALRLSSKRKYGTVIFENTLCVCSLMSQHSSYWNSPTSKLPAQPWRTDSRSTSNDANEKHSRARDTVSYQILPVCWKPRVFFKKKNFLGFLTPLPFVFLLRAFMQAGKQACMYLHLKPEFVIRYGQA